MFSEIFNIIIYRPLFNILIMFYNYIPGHDLGVAIIVITFLIRLIVWPLSRQSIASQKSMQGLQPKLQDLKIKFKDDKQALAQETMKLYKEEKLNPFASCLPLLIQLPILLGVYWVVRAGLNTIKPEMLYSFVQNPGTLKIMAFGFLNLSHPSWVLAILAGGAQFWQTKMLPRQMPEVKGDGAKDENMMAMMNKQMLYMMPIMTVFIGISLPAGLTLYWFVATALTGLQQWLMFRKDGVTK